MLRSSGCSCACRCTPTLRSGRRPRSSAAMSAAMSAIVRDRQRCGQLVRPRSSAIVSDRPRWTVWPTRCRPPAVEGVADALPLCTVWPMRCIVRRDGLSPCRICSALCRRGRPTRCTAGGGIAARSLLGFLLVRGKGGVCTPTALAYPHGGVTSGTPNRYFPPTDSQPAGQHLLPPFTSIAAPPSCTLAYGLPIIPQPAHTEGPLVALHRRGGCACGRGQ